MVSIFLMLTVVAVITLTYCCELPVIHQMFNFLINHKEDGDLLYNIGVSFISAYIFYILQVFIPDMVAKQRKEKEELPKRIIIQKDIYLFVHGLLVLWEQIQYSEEGSRTIGELFSYERIMERSRRISLRNPCGLREGRTNREYLKNEMERLIHKGKENLNRYSGNVPNEIYFSIEHLITNGVFLKKMYDSINKRENEYAYTLRDLICFDEQKQIIPGADRDIKEIKRICEWINSESRYFETHKKMMPSLGDSTIYKIDYDLKK